ncbi:IS3 family transposase [Ruminococcus sp.]|uniref:IS3 family transposase n=1 Tax=Ruminococcus sp. TaxID=41978 RepID=UPI0025ECF362|nr:IS3 family transposase [Ruminococcus sp.]MBR1432097.1 IS3 family transposase [Ruminococcus sp.]
MKKYDESQKQLIINRYYAGESVKKLAEEIGVSENTVYAWINEAMAKIKGEKLTANDYRRLMNKLERQSKMIAILKTVDCCTKSPRKLKLLELEKLYGKYETHILCEALDVDRGTFLNHIKRNKRDNVWYIKRRGEMAVKIRDVYEEFDQIFGSEKIAAILRERGENVSDRFVSELMAEMGLKSIRTNSKKEYLKDKRRNNILKQKFSVDSPNSVWASDITYFNYNSRAYYICVILDLFSRKVVAYNVSKCNSTHLTKSTLIKAVLNRKPNKGLILHTDNGTNYVSYTFEKALQANCIEHSRSRPYNSRDNAVCESFFSSLKREELYRRKITSERMLYKLIDDYMAFYNSKRPHDTLNNKTPDEFEREYYAKSGVCDER